MGDYHVKMLFDVAASPQAVKSVLSDAPGIASWWSDSVEGAAHDVGDTFQIRFPDAPAPFELKVATASEHRVDWHVADMPPWWAGTTIRFDLAADGTGTKLLFEHRDFDPANEVIPIITPAWAQILLRLKQVVESGTPDAFFVN